MCGVAAALTGVMGVLQYKQQQRAAENQASMYRAQAQMAEQNARVENKKQESIADKYAQEAANLRARHNIAQGAARAQAGAANLGISGGTSAMDILGSGWTAYGRDQANLLMNQRNDNYASRVAESNYEADAANNRAAADNVKRQARMQGIATILGTAASIVGMGVGGGTKTAPGSEKAGDFGTLKANAGHGYSAIYSTAGKGTSIIKNRTPSIFGSTDWLGKGKYNFNKPLGSW